MSIINFKEDKIKGKIISTISLDFKKWNEIIKQTKINIAKKLKIKGFRKGNVPLELVNKYVSSKEIFFQSEEKGILSAFEELKTNKEKEIEFYRVIKKTTTKISGNQFEIEFEFEKMPTIELNKYKNFDISIKTKTITKKEIELSINQKKDEFSILIESSDDRAKDKKIVNIDFEGKIDNKKIEKATSKNFSLELGSNTFIPGFESNVLGMKKGELKDIKLIFPKNYSPEFAGKEITFKVILNKIQEKKLLSTEELIQKLGLKTSIELEKFISDELIIVKNKKNKPELVKKIFEAIFKNSNFELPFLYLEREFNNLKNAQLNRLKEKKIEFKTFLEDKKITEEEFDKELKDRTSKSIKELLIFYEIAEKEKIEISTKEIQEYYNMLSEYTKKSVDEIKKIYPEMAVHNNFLKNKVEEFLIKNNNKDQK